MMSLLALVNTAYTGFV